MQIYCRNLRIDKDFTKYIEDLMKYSEIQIRASLNFELMYNVNE